MNRIREGRIDIGQRMFTYPIFLLLYYSHGGWCVYIGYVFVSLIHTKYTPASYSLERLHNVTISYYYITFQLCLNLFDVTFSY